jgi:uncharacterized membrane protein
MARTILFDRDPDLLRREITAAETPDMKRRRSIIGLSLAGMASMAAVSLLQTGIVRHLPDPPLKSFDSDQVNTSRIAYQFGLPDGTVSLASFALNVPLAALGGADRARRHPWVPLLVAAKAAAEAVGAGWYFYQMPAREKKWCGYCIAGAMASFGVLALALPEARRALGQLRSR